MADHDPRVAATTRAVIKRLVIGDYDWIEEYSGGTRLKAQNIRDSVNDYGCTLTMPPPSSFRELDVIPIEDSMPKAWSVRCDLWTEEEGHSDLTLEMTLIDTDGQFLIFEIDNLHVL